MDRSNLVSAGNILPHSLACDKQTSSLKPSQPLPEFMNPLSFTTTQYVWNCVSLLPMERSGDGLTVN